MPLPLRLSPGTISPKSLASINKTRPSSPFPDELAAAGIVRELKNILNHTSHELTKKYNLTQNHNAWSYYNGGPKAPHIGYKEAKWRGSPPPPVYTYTPLVVRPDLPQDLALVATHPSETIVRTLSREHGQQIYQAALGFDTHATAASPEENKAVQALLSPLWALLVTRAQQDTVRYDYTVLMDDLYLAAVPPKSQPNARPDTPLPPINILRTSTLLATAADADAVFSSLRAYKAPPIRQALALACPSLLTPEAITKLLSARVDDELLAELVSARILPQASMDILFTWAETSILTQNGYHASLVLNACADLGIYPGPQWFHRARLYLTASAFRKIKDTIIHYLPIPNPTTLPSSLQEEYNAICSLIDSSASMPLHLLNRAYGDRLVTVLIALQAPVDKLKGLRPAQLDSLTRRNWARLSAMPDISQEAREFLFRNLSRLANEEPSRSQ